MEFTRRCHDWDWDLDEDKFGFCPEETLLGISLDPSIDCSYRKLFIRKHVFCESILTLQCQEGLYHFSESYWKGGKGRREMSTDAHLWLGGILVKQSPHVTLGDVCSPVYLLALKLGQRTSLQWKGWQSMVFLCSLQVPASFCHPSY